jgi:hypothetical protein
MGTITDRAKETAVSQDKKKKGLKKIVTVL